MTDIKPPNWAVRQWLDDVEEDSVEDIAFYIAKKSANWGYEQHENSPLHEFHAMAALLFTDDD
jgi:hypothetical protein